MAFLGKHTKEGGKLKSVKNTSLNLFNNKKINNKIPERRKIIYT